MKCEGDFNDVFFWVIIAIKEACGRKSEIVSRETGVMPALIMCEAPI